MEDRYGVVVALIVVDLSPTLSAMMFVTDRFLLCRPRLQPS